MTSQISAAYAINVTCRQFYTIKTSYNILLGRQDLDMVSYENT